MIAVFGPTWASASSRARSAASSSVSPSAKVTAGRIFSESSVAAATGEPALHVAVELLRLVEHAVPREDHLGVLGGEVPPVGGVARLHDHRVPLRAARNVEPPVDVELRAAMAERRDRVVGEEAPARAIGHHGVGRPAVPQLLREAHELRGARVAVGVVEEAAAAEVRAVERVRARDDVPAGAPVREVVEGRELSGELVRLVERGAERADEADVAVTAASAASTARVFGRPTTSRSWMSPLCSRSRSPSARNR